LSIPADYGQEAHSRDGPTFKLTQQHQLVTAELVDSEDVVQLTGLRKQSKRRGREPHQPVLEEQQKKRPQEIRRGRGRCYR